ncbi:hypothetical protein Sjap_023484 [Stephania japonica]|uniref:Drought induced 19 protein type zinc-binding domain-containing protein n=1 Tax=Stephania japonica TaxID=461633 RepID=A0AAP0EES9_9MAGN
MSFWASRVRSAKYSVTAATLGSENHSRLDDFEGDDDARVCLPCPFCYMEIELSMLCNHLQDEHCFDVKNSVTNFSALVCPMCAANLGRDAVGHFRVHHSHMLKRRRKSQRSGTWNNISSMLGKELQEIAPFRLKVVGNIPESAPDPLISPFLCNVALPEATSIGVPIALEKKSIKSQTVDGPDEEGYKERSSKAEFVQQLVASTIDKRSLRDAAMHMDT